MEVHTTRTTSCRDHLELLAILDYLDQRETLWSDPQDLRAHLDLLVWATMDDQGLLVPRGLLVLQGPQYMEDINR